MTGSPRVEAWAGRLARSKRSLWLIALASFLETTVVPIPIELVLIPYMVANRHRIWLIATVVFAANIAAAALGYAVGYLLFESLGRWFLETFSYMDAFESFRETFRQNGFWAVFSIAATPVPFQVAMLVAGMTGYPILLFLAASSLARSIRYYGLALLVIIVGARAERLWERHAGRVGVAILALVVIGGVAWYWFCGEGG